MHEAGWEAMGLDSGFQAVRQDDFGPGGVTRIWTDREPWCFRQSEVVPFWDSEKERAIALAKAGWEQGASGTWYRKTTDSVKI